MRSAHLAKVLLAALCVLVTTACGFGERADVLLGVITALAAAWLVVYVCLRQKLVAAIILACLTAATCGSALLLGSAPAWWLAPLVLWTAFATYLNAYDVARGGGAAAA